MTKRAVAAHENMFGRSLTLRRAYNRLRRGGRGSVLSGGSEPAPSILNVKEGSEPAPSIVNVQGPCTMGDLKEDFKHNESMKEKIEEMSAEYSGYRPIRGDGNCYYRAVGFSFLERAMHAGAEGNKLLKTFIDLVTQGDFQGHAEAEASRDYVVGRLNKWRADRQWSWTDGKTPDDITMNLNGKGPEDISAALERSFVEDEGMDKGMIRVLRHATASYIRLHRDDPTPSGMTYDMTVTLGMDFPSLDKYFDDMLLKMGEDAAAVVHVALPLATGITVRMEYLDRRAAVEQKSFDFPEDDQPRHAFILIKPGHFDMLYAKEDQDHQWECKTCTAMNSINTTVCDVCGRTGIWTCNSCPKKNPVSIDTCDDCGTTRTWTCTRCTFQNPIFEDACSICEHSRT